MGESLLILRSKRLFQLFLVDGLHNGGIRMVKILQVNIDATRPGKKLILSSTFTGIPRYIMNKYKDAFAICKYARYPNYFITMTCNPEWEKKERNIYTIEFQKRGFLLHIFFYS
ncbi:hypothetical protein Ahy_A02g008268 [Arachis hypogaea]|uniref:Helitron helicase-like domain-containing protein n=1 Tax=Arachis hypogaea TaxID=3818 RepID=A0A445EE24_ARAHY|nr:hypothetical protein Ahy_A02g008268 [Arachis hypogaea]